MGESTLHLPFLRCHIVLLSKGVCLNVPHFKFLKESHNIFAYYVRNNLGNMLEKQLFHFCL
jgi:hypothetical protein